MLRELSTTGSFAIRCTASIGMVSDNLRPAPLWVGSAGGGLVEALDMSLIPKGSVWHSCDLWIVSLPQIWQPNRDKPLNFGFKVGGWRTALFVLRCTPPLSSRPFVQ